ncbi:tyrosine--tRNA ligase [candidate division KSB1 bacterium]|nr:tyrosine--tRNA ligase [candidate division KSB1 bacterium]MBL7093136.1 tyrosine--tRNA ligase [candidate division KSB1 bacterium]
MEKGNVFDVLKERGFVQQVTDEDEIRAIFESEKVTCYIGFDPTADSLHAGSLMPIMAMKHMQNHGHHPIAVIGGGTAMVGDPSGKTEMRKMLLQDTIKENGEKFKAQFAKYLDFDGGKASFVDNSDWLLELKYVDFLRDIGKHFSVNRMLAVESYKIRLETGLSFLEFNYQLLQAYDFLMLFRTKNCILQMGGDDQWGNIVAGIDLIRRLEAKKSYGITSPLLTTASGNKMGKTEKGALWLNANKTSPYEFYQYWINVDDRDVGKFLAFFTFLPMDEINELKKLQGADLRKAKQVLAFEATKVTHGEDEAKKAEQASQAAFGSGWGDAKGMPTTKMAHKKIENGINVVDLFSAVKLVSSKSEARRLIQQGGCYVNENRVQSIETVIDLTYLENKSMILRAGKKRYHKVDVS